ncbi:Serine/threonine-protein kinase prk-2 [Aphelenchoides fujianensis]|nr:Serine/threonine-protein kinase prk-2 [Aphelenchoides fujianensis]
MTLSEIVKKVRVAAARQFLSLKSLFTVVESVYALMQRKILHRDIKNENIVIDLCTGATKLVDFGAATSMKSTRHHGFQGTRLYSPPEFLIHSLYLGEEAAVWSLGVVLFACLNGQLPYQSTKDICTSHLLGPLPRLTEFSAAAEQTIQNCLSFDPFKRISLEALRSSDWIRSGEDLDWDALAKQKTEDSSADSLDQRAESGVGSSDGSGRRTIKERALAAKDC